MYIAIVCACIYTVFLGSHVTLQVKWLPTKGSSYVRLVSFPDPEHAPACARLGSGNETNIRHSVPGYLEPTTCTMPFSVAIIIARYVCRLMYSM